MTDPTHPDDDDDIERVVERVLSAHHLAEPDVRNRAWCNCQPWDTKDKPFLPAEHVKHLAQQIAAAVAVPPAAGPDDELRARIGACVDRFEKWRAQERVATDSHAYWLMRDVVDDLTAVLAAVPSAGLPTPPEALDGVWRLRNEPAIYILGGKVKHGFSTWNPAEARLLAATLLAAADVAEGGAR